MSLSLHLTPIQSLLSVVKRPSSLVSLSLNNARLLSQQPYHLLSSVSCRVAIRFQSEYGRPTCYLGDRPPMFDNEVGEVKIKRPCTGKGGEKVLEGLQRGHKLNF